MSPSLLLLLVSAAQATHFFGTVMTYYPKDPDPAGTIAVIFRYKLNFHTCSTFSWTCIGNCGNQSSPEDFIVVQEISGEWCQTETIMTWTSDSNAPLQLTLSGGNWMTNKNSILLWNAVTSVDPRTRSDTLRANAPPQTTILTGLRVPSNCRRDFNLLAFDPDGDDVRCRYGNPAAAECIPCTPPSVLSLSSSCSLSFSPTVSSNEGLYAVQLVMEDFTRQIIILTQNNGSRTNLNDNVAISKLPVQFVFIVDPVVPSCTDGLYLPRFLPPTPESRARLYAPVSQSLEIRINAEANVSTISELLVSGPHNIEQTTSGPGQFIVLWTPSANEAGENHPVCFVVQAVLNSTKYQSEQRCLVVSVGNGLITTPSSTGSTQSTPQTGSTQSTPQTGSTQSTPQTGSTSSTPQTGSTPSTPETRSTPSTPQTRSTPSTPQTGSTQSTPQTGSTPSTPETRSTPSTPQTGSTPSTPETVVGLRVRISSSSPLSDADIDSVLQQLKEELERRIQRNLL